MGNDATTRCPYCAEEILAAAKLCKHCRSPLTPAVGGPPGAPPPPPSARAVPPAPPRVDGSGGPALPAADDDVIFSDKTVRITRSRVAFASGVDYPVNAISSIRVAVGRNPSAFAWYALAIGSGIMTLFGILLMIAASSDRNANPGFGLICSIFSFAMTGLGLMSASSTKPPYILFVTTSGREQQAMVGDRKTIEQIAEAIRTAIDRRG